MNTDVVSFIRLFLLKDDGVQNFRLFCTKFKATFWLVVAQRVRNDCIVGMQRRRVKYVVWEDLVVKSRPTTTKEVE